jgi:hypothetical protein
MPYILKANEQNITDSAGKDSRKVNDIVSIRNNIDNLTGREKKYCTVVELTAQQYEDYKAVREKVKLYHKSETTEWTEKPPARKDGWTDKDGTVYELTEKPRFMVGHDETGFHLNVDQEKNKTVLIAAKKESKDGKIGFN